LNKFARVRGVDKAGRARSRTPPSSWFRMSESKTSGARWRWHAGPGREVRAEERGGSSESERERERERGSPRVKPTAKSAIHLHRLGVPAECSRSNHVPCLLTDALPPVAYRRGGVGWGRAGRGAEGGSGPRGGGGGRRRQLRGSPDRCRRRYGRRAKGAHRGVAPPRRRCPTWSATSAPSPTSRKRRRWRRWRRRRRRRRWRRRRWRWRRRRSRTLGDESVGFPLLGTAHSRPPLLR
jgi:hypothetical protein